MDTLKWHCPCRTGKSRRKEADGIGIDFILSVDKNDHLQTIQYDCWVGNVEEEGKILLQFPGSRSILQLPDSIENSGMLFEKKCTK